MEKLASRYKNHFPKIAKPYFTISLLAVFSIFLVWLPFIFRIGPQKSEIKKYGFEVIQRMYDGPLYAIAAKSLYRSDKIFELKTFDPKYFAIHPPGYPFLIKAASPLFGYLNGMLVVNVLCTIFLGWTLFYFFNNVVKLEEPFYLTAVVLLTPRMLISSATGSSEIVFILCSMLSIILIHKHKYVLAAFLAFYASFTRMPGILLGFAIIVYLIIERKQIRQNIWMILPLVASFTGFLAVCLFYLRQYGDFFAYFNSGVVVQTGVVYSQFFVNAKGVGDKYLEDILFYFGIGWISLIEKSKNISSLMSVYSWVFFIFVITISHRDISRYILPLTPFLVAINANYLKKTVVKKSFVLLIPALYLFIVNFIAKNYYSLTIDALR